MNTHKFPIAGITLKTILSATVCMAVIAPSPVLGQTGSADEALEEIVVTGIRRSLNRTLSF